MQDSTTGAIASFNTAFSFQFTGGDLYYYPDYSVVHGDAFTFTFATTDRLSGPDPESSTHRYALSKRPTMACPPIVSLLWSLTPS